MQELTGEWNCGNGCAGDSFMLFTYKKNTGQETSTGAVFTNSD
jgi:hypothetical protein